jgi:hypothetical protein
VKDLEGENARLKRMYAELSLTRLALQEVVAKSLSPRQRADIPTPMVKEYGTSVRNACTAVRLPRSGY